MAKAWKDLREQSKLSESELKRVQREVEKEAAEIRARAEEFDQYWTPPALAKVMVEWANLRPGMRVLEPSCGAGDLVRWMPGGVLITAMDIDREVFRHKVLHAVADCRSEDFLAHRGPSNSYDIAVMNPPYGFVGHGKARKASDRLHVQHALRLAPEVICLVRANFLWGQERYRHIFRYAYVSRMAILVHRPSFYGPALRADQVSARHEYVVLHLKRWTDRKAALQKVTSPDLEFWTQDWALAA